MKNNINYIKNIVIAVFLMAAPQTIANAIPPVLVAQHGSAIILKNDAGWIGPVRLQAVEGKEDAFYLINVAAKAYYSTSADGWLQKVPSEGSVFTFEASGIGYVIGTDRDTFLSIVTRGTQKYLMHNSNRTPFHIEMAPISVEEASSNSKRVTLNLSDKSKMFDIIIESDASGHFYLKNVGAVNGYLSARQNGDLLYVANKEAAGRFMFERLQSGSYNIQTTHGTFLTVTGEQNFPAHGQKGTPVTITEDLEPPHASILQSLEAANAAVSFPDKHQLKWKLHTGPDNRFAFELRGQPGHFLSADTDGTTTIRDKGQYPEAWEMFQIQENVSRNNYEVITHHGTFLAPSPKRATIRHFRIAEGQTPPSFSIEKQTSTFITPQQAAATQQIVRLSFRDHTFEATFRLHQAQAEGNYFHLESREHPGQYLSARPSGELTLEQKPSAWETFRFELHKGAYKIHTHHGTMLVNTGRDGKKTALFHAHKYFAPFTLEPIAEGERSVSPLHSYMSKEKKGNFTTINGRKWRAHQVNDGQYAFEDPGLRGHYLSANKDGTLTIREKKDGPKSWETFLLQWNETGRSYGLRTAHGTFVENNQHGNYRKMPLPLTVDIK